MGPILSQTGPRGWGEERERFPAIGPGVGVGALDCSVNLAAAIGGTPSVWVEGT